MSVYIGTTYNGIGDISVLKTYDYEFFTSSINVWYTTDNSSRWFYKEKDGTLTVSYNDPFKIYTVDKYKYIAPTVEEANIILKDVIKADKELFSIKGATPEDRANDYMWKKLPPMTK